MDFVFVVVSVFWFFFILWFTLSVVEKLKRIEQVLRALLQVVSPEHPLVFRRVSETAKQENAQTLATINADRERTGLEPIVSEVNPLAVAPVASKGDSTGDIWIRVMLVLGVIVAIVMLVIFGLRL